MASSIYVDAQMNNELFRRLFHPLFYLLCMKSIPFTQTDGNSTQIMS